MQGIQITEVEQNRQFHWQGCIQYVVIYACTSKHASIVSVSIMDLPMSIQYISLYVLAVLACSTEMKNMVNIINAKDQQASIFSVNIIGQTESKQNIW